MNLHQMKFNWLTVDDDRDVVSTDFVWCVCDCGRRVSKYVNSVRRGLTRSCGCLRRGSRPLTVVTSEEYSHPLHSAWSGMISRCYSEKHESYPDYGGRGIRVEDRWLTFANFISDVGERPEGMTLDRLDGNSDYGPTNFRWATALEQLLNRSNTLSFIYKGESLTVTELAEKTGMLRDKLYRRYLRMRQGKVPNAKVLKTEEDLELMRCLSNPIIGAVIK